MVVNFLIEDGACIGGLQSRVCENVRLTLSFIVDFFLHSYYFSIVNYCRFISLFHYRKYQIDTFARICLPIVL